MSILFTNVTAVTMDDRMHVLPGAYVGVRNGRIAYIGRQMPAEPVREAIDGTGMVLMPGLINCHTHLVMNGLRGWSDDQPLQPWLEACGKVEDAPAPDLGDADERAAQATGFVVRGHAVVFSGICPECQAKARAKTQA